MASIIQLFRSEKNKRAEFNALIAPHIELMYRMAFQWTRNQEDAEDLIQDVLIKLADRINEMKEVEKLSAWLLKIVYRRFVDRYRHEKLRETVSLDDSYDESSDGASRYLENLLVQGSEEQALQAKECIEQAMETLDEDQQTVVKLHFIEGYTALEMASILNISPGTVKSRLQRAKTKLKIFLSSGPF